VACGLRKFLRADVYLSTVCGSSNNHVSVLLYTPVLLASWRSIKERPPSMLLFSSPWLNRRSRERQRKVVAKRMRTDFPNPFAALPCCCCCCCCCTVQCTMQDKNSIRMQIQFQTPSLMPSNAAAESARQLPIVVQPPSPGSFHSLSRRHPSPSISPMSPNINIETRDTS
jgi:hypothetical protein